MIFGEHPCEINPVPHSYFGQSGWYALPRGWNSRYEGIDLVASPNASFIPKYYCSIAEDGVAVFQDLSRSLLTP